MTPVPSQSDGPVGDVAAPGPWPQPPRARWWQHRAVRVAAGALVVVALVLVLPWTERWRWHVAGSAYLELTTQSRSLCVGLALMPFMRKVSYRKRDILIILLVPLYGQYVAGKVVSRLLALPRRDWPPRPDEVDRVVRLPGDPSTYLLRPTFADAEALRTRWCVNPGHDHPYDGWAIAHQIGCSRRDSA